MTCLNPQVIPYKGKDATVLKFMSVPCGKCEGCLSDRRNAWCYRLESQMRHSKHSYFVTLTYDESNLPLTNGEYVCRYKDFVCWDHIENLASTLYPKDVTDYIKRVRSKLPKLLDGRSPLTYFLCGEYGEHESNRPHYHIGFFYSDDGTDTSPAGLEYVIQNEWKYGFVTIAPLIPSRCAYLCKYILKDSDLQAKYEFQHDYYSRASHGLGIDGFFEDERYYGTDFNSVHLCNGSKIGIPRYFRKKFYVQEDWNTLKQIQNEERNSKYHEKIVNRLRQDYKLSSRSRDSEQAFKYADYKLDHKTVRRVRQSLRKRKKDF